jgi:hypothetical protein
MPGQQAINITLRRCVVDGQSNLSDWLSDACPTSLTGTDFDASSGQVAIEEISLTAAKLAVEYSP